MTVTAMSEIDALCKEINQWAENSGLNDQDRDSVQLTKIHGTVSELMDAAMSGEDLVEIYFEDNTEEPFGVPVLLADLLIRVFHFSQLHGIPLTEALHLKMEHNSLYPEHYWLRSS